MVRSATATPSRSSTCGVSRRAISWPPMALIGGEISVLGRHQDSGPYVEMHVGPDEIGTFKLFVKAPAESLSGKHDQLRLLPDRPGDAGEHPVYRCVQRTSAARRACSLSSAVQGAEAMARQRADGWWYPWIFVAGMLVVIAVNITMVDATRSTPSRAWKPRTPIRRVSPTTIRSPPRGRRRHGAGASTSATLRAPKRCPPIRRARGRAGDHPARQGGRAIARARSLGGAGPADPRGLRYLGSRWSRWASGEYRAEATLPLAGQWDVRVSARRGDEDFQATRRIFVR